MILLSVIERASEPSDRVLLLLGRLYTELSLFIVDAMRPFQALIFHAFCPREVDTVLQILDRFIVAKCV
ncbi:MAG: hypothetical protein U1E25_14615 [Methylocystis sp.]